MLQRQQQQQLKPRRIQQAFDAPVFPGSQGLPASFAKYDIQDPGQRSRTEGSIHRLQELTNSVVARFGMRNAVAVAPSAQLNYHPHHQLPSVIEDIRKAVDDCVACVEDGGRAERESGTLALAHPAANAVVWAAAALGRARAASEIFEQVVAGNSKQPPQEPGPPPAEREEGSSSDSGKPPQQHWMQTTVPEATDDDRRYFAASAAALDALCRDLPSPQPLYAELMSERLGPSVSARAQSGRPWLALPSDLVPTTVQSRRGTHDGGEEIDVVDEARASPAALRKALFLPPEARAAFHELLADVRTILDRARIQNWVTGGTLLGALRHGDLIPWDDDVDLCVCAEPGESLVTFEARLREALGFPYACEANPLFGYKVYSSRRLPASCQDFCLFGVFVDLFLVAPRELLPAATRAPTLDHGFFAGRMHTPTDRVLAYPDARSTWPAEVWTPSDLVPPRPAKLGPQTRFRLPGGAEAYATRMYGADWATTCRVPQAAHGRIYRRPIQFSLELANAAARAAAE